MTDNPENPITSTDATFDPYYDQLYRYEIAAAMNAVIRACRDTVRHHSSHGFWTPATTDDAPDHQAFIHTARQNVLTKLQCTITAAETVLNDIEADRTRRTVNRHPGPDEPQAAN